MGNKNISKEYKKTEIGVIPEDWEVVKLGDIGVFSKGKGISKKDMVNNGAPCVRYGEIYTKYDFKINKFCSFISEDTASNSKKIKKNDILFAGSGETLEDIGKSVAYLGDTEAFAGGDIIIFTPQKTVNSLTLSYILNTGKVRKNISMLGQGNSVVHIYASHLKNLKIPLPPLPEQKKISKILSTWDNAIEKLEELINKKIEYKKGLMQKLLSGELRFPEFKEDWEEVRIGDVLYGLEKEKVKNPENYELLTVKLHCKGVVKTGKYPKPTKKGRPYFIRNEGELLIGRQNFHNGGFGIVPKGVKNCIASNAITSLLPLENCNLKFILYYISRYDYYKRVEYLMGGTGQKEISKNQLLNLKILLPLLQEQQKIAEILTLQDKEIQLNKNKLKLLKEQKKGLMQNLLTGKIRVKT